MQLPDSFVIPDYQSATIANMPPTLARWLDVPFAGLPPLRDDLWQPVAGDVKRVVVILIDALGWNIIERLRGELGVLDSAEIAAPITSVFPSNTAIALSSVWTGTAPAQHGLMGFKQFMPEFGVVAQMIGLSPLFMGIGARDVLAKAGMEPEHYLHTAGSAEQLSAQGILVHDFKGRDIVNSALSEMHGRGVSERHGIISFSDMLTQARSKIENNLDERLYLHLYWPTVDMISHLHGAMGESTLNEARTLLQQLQTLFLDALSPAAREGTLVCLMADHGHIDYKAEQAIKVGEHPELQAMLLMQATGGARFPYLYAKQGKVQAVIDYINHNLGDLAMAISAETAIDLNLFGPVPHAPRARERIGDVVVLMRQNAIWLDPFEERILNFMKAGHGGLSADEMEAPWIVWRLG